MRMDGYLLPLCKIYVLLIAEAMLVIGLGVLSVKRDAPASSLLSITRVDNDTVIGTLSKFCHDTAARGGMWEAHLRMG